MIAQGLIDFKLCSGSLDAVLENESYKRFFMHRTGHWLGMDVHDVGDYRDAVQPGARNADKENERPWRMLEPGMVVTVEPGIYVRPAADVPEQFWNIGIRIEDDALVTPDGCRILSDGVPSKIADIEALMKR